MRIRVIRNGPYHVTGNVPLLEKIIVRVGNGYEYRAGRELPQFVDYELCRCGKSKEQPFCDDAHEDFAFDGTERASRALYEDRADELEGPGVDLLDDGRCAFARFCHTDRGDVWELVDESGDPEVRDAAIKAAGECPTGRLTALLKNGDLVEPELEPSVAILQDPEKGVSSGVLVQGGIELESADGHVYERRNRMTLCRCGRSRNQPFCDATHVRIRFVDQEPD